VHLLNNVIDFVRNARIVRNGIEYSSLIPDYLQSRWPRTGDRPAFDAVHTYVMFIGIGRSGTTLIGALLDAHPHIIIANQQTTLKYLRPRLFSRSQIFCLLLRNSRKAARTGRMGGGGYSYAVTGQWQGRFDTIEVIGDKSRSAQAVTWLTTSPALLEDLALATQARIRMIHVVRNPYDTIATRSMRRRLSLERISSEYFSLCDRLQRLIRRIEEVSEYDVGRIPVYLEDFVQHPDSGLAAVCDGLGVGAETDYLRGCARIVRKEPHKSRYDVAWDPNLVAEVQRNLETIPFLRRYSFDD